MAAQAAAALTARGVMVDRDAISHRHRLDAVADRGHDARRLVAEDGRKLAGDVPVGHVGPAHATGEHVAHDLAGARDRVFDLLDADLFER
jgi:hypothetical protein